jgi:hypothetical protein
MTSGLHLRWDRCSELIVEIPPPLQESGEEGACRKDPRGVESPHIYRAAYGQNRRIYPLDRAGLPRLLLGVHPARQIAKVRSVHAALVHPAGRACPDHHDALPAHGSTSARKRRGPGGVRGVTIGSPPKHRVRTQVWAISKHGERRSSAVAHEHAPPPEIGRLGTPAATFQAGHASSILVTRSTASGPVASLLDAMVLLTNSGWQTRPMDDDVQALVVEQLGYYSAWAPDYDDVYLGKDWDRCIEELPITGDVLELACGSGHWTPCWPPGAAR